MIENNKKYLDKNGLIKVFELLADKYATSNEEIYKSIENIKENLIPQVFYLQTTSDIKTSPNSLIISSMYRADSKNDLIDKFREIQVNPERSTLLTIVQFKFKYDGIDSLATLYPCKREPSKLMLFGDAGIVNSSGVFVKKITLLITLDKTKPEKEFIGKVIDEVVPI